MALVPVVSSCGEEAPLEPAEFAEQCGVEGPVQLFGLEPDEVLTDEPLLFEGRYFYTTGRTGKYSWDTDNHVVRSVGPCGGAPRRIAEDIRFVDTDERWPGVLFGCHWPTGDLVTLDPAGERAPHVAFVDVGCTTPRSDAPAILRLVGEEGGPAALVLHALPDDPTTETSEPRILLDEVSTPEYPLTTDSWVLGAGDLAFVLTTDWTLLRIDLTDGAVAVEQTGVRNFLVSRDGRYLLYQDVGLTSAEPERTEGVVLLRDRSTGAGVTLATTDLRYGGSSLGRANLGLFTLKLPNGVQRIYFLPALDFVDLPRYLSLRWGLGGDRYVLQRGGDGPLHVTDLREAGSTMPIFGTGWLVWVEPEGAFVLDVPSLWEESSARADEGALWFAPVDGQPLRRLADRASRDSRLLDEGRLLTKLDIDEEGLADFMVVDLDTREERLIDRRVASNTSLTYIYFSSDIIEDDVVYLVVDGERKGVWRARLASR